MKQTSNVFRTHFLFLALSAAILSSCQKAAERTAKLDDATAASVKQMSDITEVTTAPKDAKDQPKSLYVSAKQADVDKLNSGLKQVVIADTSDAIMKKITKDDTKKVVDEHLKTGAVGFVIVNGDDGKPLIKVMRVVPDTTLSNKYNGDILSLKYMRGLKDLSTTVDAKAQSDISNSLRAMKYKNPADFGEKFGLVEITSIKIDKMGIIENKRNDYGEKMSVLVLTEKPMGQATHFILGAEVGSDEDAAAMAKAAADAAAAK